ncbi:MAG: 4Fe-4S binding protein [Candidatus Diapherotrites archaeon]|nr:4Fe-4S binding protein [Candidatus Diapherotrites archaeon]
MKADASAARVDTGSWRVNRPVIDLSKCIKCHMCWLDCPDGAIYLDKDGKPHVDYTFCKGCLVCANECPVKCIAVEAEKK